MSKIRRIYDDEIDLFDLFKSFWDGKWIMSAFVFFAVLCGVGLNLTKKPVYKSTLTYSLITVPPFYGRHEVKVLKDFAVMFHSQNMFKDWKKGKKSISIVFEDLALREVVNGIVMSKDEGARIATLANKKKGDNLVIVKSNKLKMLDELFNYANHINDKLKSKYILRTQDEINAIETRFAGFTTKNPIIVEQLLILDSYLVAVEKGANVFAIQRPTIPKKMSTGLSFILPISVLLGLMAGVFFIVVRNVSRKQKR
jgi:hypothetical protein